MNDATQEPTDAADVAAEAAGETAAEGEAADEEQAALDAQPGEEFVEEAEIACGRQRDRRDRAGRKSGDAASRGRAGARAAAVSDK